MKSKELFANNHTPEGTLSKIPESIVDLMRQQTPSKEALTIKQIVSLYFSNNKECEIRESNGNDVIVVPASLIMDSAKTSSYYVGRKLKPFIDQVQESTASIKKLNKEDMEVIQGKGKELVKEFNYFFISKEVKRQLGLDGNEMHVTFISQVELVNDNLFITVSPFLKTVKTESKSNFIITANTKDVVKFQNDKTLNFYYFIASLQSYTNFIEIDLEEFKEKVLHHDLEVYPSFAKFKVKVLDPIVNDKVLNTSTCALKVFPGKKGKEDKYITIKKNGNTVKSLRFNFKDNRELGQELLNLPYPFIKHLKDTKLNKGTLVQIIARVKDGFIEEEWVNYLINSSYEEWNRSGNKKHPDIGPLVWIHIRDGNHKSNEFKLYPELCKVSDTAGVSMQQIIKSKKDQEKLINIPAKTSAKNNEVLTLIKTYCNELPDSDRFFEYASQFLRLDTLNVTFKHKPKNVTYPEFIKHSVYRNLKSTFHDSIGSLFLDLGFDENKHKILFSVLEESDNEIIDILFRHLNFETAKFELSIEYRKELKSTFLNFLKVHA